jgi:hypothetical protein
MNKKSIRKLIKQQEVKELLNSVNEMLFLLLFLRLLLLA